MRLSGEKIREIQKRGYESNQDPLENIKEILSIQLASLNEDMKLIGDEEICKAIDSVPRHDNTSFELFTIRRKRAIANAQLSADRLTRDKKREELEARNKELVYALKSIREWLMFPEEIIENGIWNEQFVKANNLTNKVLAPYLAQEKG